jgi:hypothetical protein
MSKFSVFGEERKKQISKRPTENRERQTENTHENVLGGIISHRKQKTENR